MSYYANFTHELIIYSLIKFFIKHEICQDAQCKERNCKSEA